MCVPSTACDKDCPYCISKLTPAPPIDEITFNKNIPKIKSTINNLGITSILITGKGEPFLYSKLPELINSFKEYPLEIQTNGKVLSKLARASDIESSKLLRHYLNHINVVSISIDSYEQFAELNELIRFIRYQCPQTIIRASFNINTHLFDSQRVDGITWCVDVCRNAGIRQVTFRRLAVPENIPTGNGVPDGVKAQFAVTKQWVEEYASFELFVDCYEQLNGMIERTNAPLIRKFNFGGRVYDVGGISVALMDVGCVQEQHDEANLRSLIYHQDGHLYTSWNSLGSILF